MVPHQQHRRRLCEGAWRFSCHSHWETTLASNPDSLSRCSQAWDPLSGVPLATLGSYGAAVTTLACSGRFVAWCALSPRNHLSHPYYRHARTVLAETQVAFPFRSVVPGEVTSVVMRLHGGADGDPSEACEAADGSPVPSSDYVRTGVRRIREARNGGTTGLRLLGFRRKSSLALSLASVVTHIRAAYRRR